MRRATLAILLALGLVFVGCKKKEEASKPSEEKPAVKDKKPVEKPRTEPRTRPVTRPAAAPVAKTEVKLKSPGAKPHKPLRYALKAGTKQTLVMTVNMNTKTVAGGKTIPVKMPVIYEMPVEVQAAGKDRRIIMSGIGLKTGAGAAPMVAQAMQKMAGMFKNLKISQVMDDRGFVKSVEFTLPPNLPPQMKAVLDQAKGSLRRSMQFSNMPFPVEPIGVGAQWTATTNVQMQMIKMVATMEITLKEWKGNKIKLAVKISGKAPNQVMKSKGKEIHLSKFTYEGNGTIDGDLTAPAGTAAIKMKMEMKGEVAAAGKKVPMEVTMDMDMNLKTK